jgi:hypothetical protein
MGASICCAEAEAYTQFTIFDLPKLKKQCLIFNNVNESALVLWNDNRRLDD